MGQSLSSSNSSSSSSTSNSSHHRSRRTTNHTSPSPPSSSSSLPSASSSNNNNNNSNSNQDSSATMGQPNTNISSHAPSMQPQQPQPQQPPQQQQQQQQQTSSRVLRSTAERRRRNNLFSNFYPLLSRNSSSSNNNAGNGSSEPNNSGSGSNSSDRVRTDSPGPSNSASGPSTATRSAASWPEGPPSRSGAASPGMTTRSSTRSPAVQSPPPSSIGVPSSGRTPRGLSRVQRMYDEQSIRSTRSSSRASSFVAASPPIHTPSPSNTGNQQQASAIEYMDIDPESVGVTAQQYQTPPQSQTRPVMRPSALSQSALSSSGLVTTQTATTAAATPTTFTAAPVRESGPRTRSATAAGLQDQPAPSSSASSTTTTTTTAATAVGSDDYSFRTGLSNPRGGTSISSSLLPISPDSDGDDDMDRDVAMDQSPSTPSLAQPHRAHNHTHTHAHGHNHTHGRRFPGPEIFAQIMMSLHESAATTSMTPSAPTAAAAATSEDANSSTMDTTGAPRRPAPTPLGRTRLRSSSMRGLFGYQPTNELADEERPAGPETDATGSAEAETETGAPRAERPGGRFAHQIPLFLQLLAEISRMSRNPSEADSGQTEGADRPADTATGTADAHQHAHPNTTTTGPTHGTDPLVEPSAEPSADAGALPRLRRPNTTIRLIQLGHGVRHPRPAGSTTAGAGATTGATAATTATGEEQAGTEGREGPAAPHGEEVNETFVMFLSPPEGMDEPESDDPAAPGNDDPESARNRARQRAPWVILTLSGAYLNSMMGAGGDGEGGSTYDDLWMLANMIGPARPITTTQEAIDNAGFAVGRFEQALQGMRNVTTLGDGSKCLVCMSEYEEGEDMRALKCNHGFHQECIDKWLTTGANKCPVCRAAAVVTETPMAAEPEVSVNPSAPEE